VRFGSEYRRLWASNLDPGQASESGTNMAAYKAHGGVGAGRRLGVKRRADSQAGPSNRVIRSGRVAADTAL